MALIYYPPTQNGLQKSLNAQLDTGHTTSMTLNNVTGVQNKPGIVLLGRIDSGGTELSAAVREFIVYTGTSGNTLTGLTRGTGGSTDQDHAVGTVVEFIPDITWAQGLIDFLLVAHNEADGTLKELTSHSLVTPKITTSINDSNGNELIKVTPTASAVNEITLINGATGVSAQINASGETNTGLDIKMNGTGKLRKPTIVHVPVFGPATDSATGDGKAMFEVPEELNGMDITAVGAYVFTAGTTNTTDIQIRNVTDSVDILSTKITIDSTEKSSRTGATPAVIDATKDDIVTGDLLAIDVDAVSTTAAKGLTVWFRAELP